MLILRVALNSPLRSLFDYLPPDGYSLGDFYPAQRLQVPFGKNSIRTGIIISITNTTQIPKHRLKKALALLDATPLFPAEHLKFITWTSHYYHHPIGDTVFTSIPSILRKGKVAKITQTKKITATTEKYESIVTCQNEQTWAFKPNQQQQDAIDKIIADTTTYQGFLLNGITGSGKTEIYLQLIRHLLTLDKQILILVPEIGLTSQFIDRIKQRFGDNIAVLHSGLSETKRLNAWLKARDGIASIVLGTRSAIWTPIPKLGMIIVDEEHDLAYKQQHSLHYSARDLSLIRGQKEKIPIVLGSATPSMESMKNVKDGRYQELRLSKRVHNAKLPDIQIYDVRNKKMYGAISQYLLNNIAQRLQHKQQTLLFLNRRGYAPVIMCHGCGFISQCPRCEVYMTFHKHKNKLLCHHCEHSEHLPNTCPDCLGEQFIDVGHGTERLEETLAELLPTAKILRIDHDSTRRKGSMQKMLDAIHTGNADILIGTQMLAKGHHFANVTLVGIVDADRGLFSVDYRASERMAQILMQVSGRAGRGNISGIVIAQTHYPEHPLLHKLAQHDYQQFAQLLLEERRQTQLPPFSFQALIRTESKQQAVAIKFLNMAKTKLQTLAQGKLEIHGPVPAPMEKRAGRYRLQLIIQAKSRQTMKKFLTPWIEVLAQLPEARKVRWSVDVDPQDMI